MDLNEPKWECTPNIHCNLTWGAITSDPIRHCIVLVHANNLVNVSSVSLYFFILAKQGWVLIKF